MRWHNAANGVHEFGLLYPEPDDPRALRWFRRDSVSGVYEDIALPATRRFRSQAVPGLELEILDRLHWEPGRKVRLWYLGVRVPTAEEEGQRADEEARRAAREASRAEEEARRPCPPRSRARLRAWLDQTGQAAVN